MPPRRDPNNNNSTDAMLQQMIAAQTQLMTMMAPFMANQNAPPPPPPPPPQVDMLERFLKLRPTKFSNATEPIVDDDWLRSVNKDLVTCECTEPEDRKSTRLNSSHSGESRMPSSA